MTDLPKIILDFNVNFEFYPVLLNYFTEFHFGLFKN